VTDLSSDGVSVTLPAGWEGRMFRRPAAGDLAAATIDGPAAPPGQTTNTVVHVATIPLPPGVGDFASGAVEALDALDALIVLFEYDPEAVSQPLFAAEGMPRRLAPADFSPSMLQRTLRGQAGVQHFFHEAERAFCLYVVLGSYQNRARVVPEVNAVLATFAIDTPPGPPDVGGPVETVVDVLRSRPDFSTFFSLVDESDLLATLAGERAVTVFAPIDSSFDESSLADLRSDADLLRRRVLQQFVRERLSRADLGARTSVVTAADSELAVSATSTSLVVGGTLVEARSIDATNGVVYVTHALFAAPR
jgi:uncharacterized surface protein with fasciclin (FAS1) repeats